MLIRFATIGTSSITEQFIEAARLEPSLRYTAAYSRSAQKASEFAGKHGAEYSFSNLQQLAEFKNIDAVYIASPNAFHAEQCKLLLEAGKHIICEKPITTNLTQYSELHKIAKKNNLVYMEAMMSVNVEWHSKILTALREIGNIALARIDFCQRSSRYDSFINGNPQNIFDMSLHTGTLMDLGIYCVYAAVDLFGEPERITSVASLFKNGADRSGASLFDYGSFSALLSYSKAGQSAIGSEIIGDKGTLKIGSISQFNDVVLIKNNEPQTIVPSFSRSQVMLGEIRNFAKLIAYPEKSGITMKRLHFLANAAHGCMDKIKLSAELIYPPVQKN